MNRTTIWVLAAALAVPAAGVRAQQLDPADFALTDVADSADYLLYARLGLGRHGGVRGRQ